jgi:hypothetical protein
MELITMNALDEFGKRLMEKVRDETVSDWEMILSGAMKGERAERIRALVESNPQAIPAIVPDIVDSVLHRLLNWMETDQEFELCAKDSVGLKALSEESDGLAGELYGSRGWITKYSKVGR